MIFDAENALKPLREASPSVPFLSSDDEYSQTKSMGFDYYYYQIDHFTFGAIVTILFRALGKIGHKY